MLSTRMWSIKPAPVTLPWYLSGGIAAQSCLAAWQPIGAASKTESYINLANPGTYDASVGTSPAWDSAIGWTFDGNVPQYLVTGLGVNNILAALVRYSNRGSLNGCAFGGRVAAYNQQGFGILPRSQADGLAQFDFGKRLTAVCVPASGVIGISGTFCFVNGAKQLGTVAGSTVQTDGAYIGVYNQGGSVGSQWSGSIAAIDVFSDVLTDSQVSALTIAMQGL